MTTPALYEIENGESNGRVYHFCDDVRSVDSCRNSFLRDNPQPPQMIAGTSEPIQDSECDYCGKPLADPRDARLEQLLARISELESFANAVSFDPYSLTPDQWASEARQALRSTNPQPIAENALESDSDSDNAILNDLDTLLEEVAERR